MHRGKSIPNFRDTVVGCELPITPQKSNPVITTTFSMNTLAQGLTAPKEQLTSPELLEKEQRPKVLVTSISWMLCGVPVLLSTLKKNVIQKEQARNTSDCKCGKKDSRPKETMQKSFI